MTMVIEKKLRDFHFWGGAATNAAKLTPEELDQVEEYMETLPFSEEEYWNAAEINATFWFDFENVCEWIDLDYEEVMARE